MAETTGIAWCDHTYNPWRGCTKVSPGCTNCYAETMSKRNPSVLGEWGPKGNRAIAAESYWKLPARWDRMAQEAGERRRVFCASLADVFEDRPEVVASRQRLFHLIGRTPHLDWLLLTKRPENVERFGAEQQLWYPQDGLPRNVWLGVSVENQAAADERVPLLLQTPAAVRFLSVEPMLGPVEFSDVSGRADAVQQLGRQALDGIGWVIVGGESGPKARACPVEWIRSVAEQCVAADVPCFVKQASGPRPGMQGQIPDSIWALKQFPACAAGAITDAEGEPHP